MKPNVLHIIDSFEQGGSERLALQLVRQLHESGRCDARIACLQNKGSLRNQADRLHLGEIPEYPLTSFYDRNFVVQLRRLARFLKDNEIDVIHTHDFYTNIFGLTAAAMARVSVRVGYKGETDGFRTSAQKRLERSAFRLAHRVVANSEAVRRQLIREGVPAGKVVKHYNGLDLERVKPQFNATRHEILAMLGLPDRRLVSIVANLQHPVKDHPMFLRAAARVRAAIPDAAFVIAGEGKLMPSLRELAAQLGLERDVFFIGRCEKVAELLSVSDVCALSSTGEGFSNAILEYMAAASPVVVTDVGGAREAVLEGETGYIVAAGNDLQMADRVIDLLRDPQRARAMGQHGRTIVEEKFSCSQHLANTLDLYFEVLGRKFNTGASAEGGVTAFRVPAGSSITSESQAEVGNLKT
ncbi:MAG TPA: glycosyltransferase [Pyrinomonadaceae bacterium]|nr:glycosyltransferase [Pyrinomonadaceae bacterium]